MPVASRATISSFSAADLAKFDLFLGEAHARAAAVLGDELYAAGFKASPHHVERCATRLMRICLKLAHSYNADTRLSGEFLLAPIKEAASGSALRR
jgi:hypothetical protein